MSSVVGDSQISLKYCRRHLLAAIQLAMNCSELTNRMRFIVVWTFINNGTRHHSGQNVVDSRGAADSDLKVHALHYANELLACARQTFLSRTSANSLNMQKQCEKKC